MSSVTDQDLLDLLTLLYQGSMQHSPRAVPPAVPQPVLFFRREDLEALAGDLDLPLPWASLDVTLALGLRRGLYQRSLQRGTNCNPLCGPSAPLNPVQIFAYNPSLLKVNPHNQALLAGTDAGIMAGYQRISGTAVKQANNRAPFYGTRGYATWTQDSPNQPQCL